MIEEQEILELLESEWLPGSVSSGDALPLSSVSGGDAAYYEINIYSVSGNDGAAAQEMQYTLWDKPLEEYTVTEGLLLLLDLMILVALIWAIVQGGYKIWQK